MASNVHVLPVRNVRNTSAPTAQRAVIALRTPKRRAKRAAPVAGGAPSPQQRRWLQRGLDQAGGKLPLFDEFGQRVSERTVRACIKRGWAEPWFDNPIKPDWLVCRLTEQGRKAAA